MGDIGKIKYDGLKLSKKEKEELQKSKFLEDNLSHKTRKRKKNKNEYDDNLFGARLGAQEIGKIKYKGTKLTKEQNEELRQGKVLEDRVHHKIKKNKDRHRRSKSLIGSKMGPIEMGKNKNYKGTKMEYASENENDDDMLVEKTHIVIKKKWGLKQMDNIQIESSDDDALYDSDASSLNSPNFRSIKSEFVSNRSSSKKRVTFKRTKSMTPKSPSTPKRMKRVSKIKKKRRKKTESECDEEETKKTKKKKEEKKEQNVGKYKKKLRRHYASESDQEYVENMKQHKDEIEAEENVQKMPQLIQSTSLSPKHSSLIADDDDVKEDEVEQNEVVHIVHEIDTSDASDTDLSDNGSLNALSSSDEDDENENGVKRWI